MQAKPILTAILAAASIMIAVAPAAADETRLTYATVGPAQSHCVLDLATRICSAATPDTPVDPAADDNQLAKPVDPPSAAPAKPRQRRCTYRAYGYCIFRHRQLG